MSLKNSVAKKTGLFLFFTGPTLIAFISILIIPFFYGIYLTFTDWNAISQNYQIVGFQNYITAFTDGGFLTQFLITCKYVFISTFICNILAFLLAYALTREIKLQEFMRSGFFIPNLIGGIVLGYIWRFLFANVFTLIGKNYGIEALSRSFLSDPNRAIWALIIVTIWQYSGYLMIIYIAGIINIPKEVLESASLDGAHGLKKIFHIVIPLIVPSIVICVFISLSRGFMAYDLNLSLTNGKPFGSSQLASMYVYQQAFLNQKYGLGQAEAIILFIVVAALSVTQVLLTKKYEVES
jgi:raffinose/stachyose/melibiose transport system permease protein